MAAGGEKQEDEKYDDEYLMEEELPTFLFFGPFCERISQMRPSWKDFKKWTLSSAPWTAAPRLDESAPRITAPRWEAALPSWNDVAADVAPGSAP
jgi:hypothetical protein